MENNLKIEGYELLNQKVYRVLKESIIKGFLEPGTKLLENKIAEEMQVSRTPVREAHKLVGGMVIYCLENKKNIKNFPKKD